MRFLDRFDVILFDLNGTIMFGHDRIGRDEDYFATYRAVGGSRLDRDAVTAVMRATCVRLLNDYDTPACYDDFPSLEEALGAHADPIDVPALARVFAAHEIGTVADDHAAWLRRMAATHQLGVVSNICGHPAVWREYFAKIDLLEVFTCTVFSSEGRCIKPSLRLFERAMASFRRDAKYLFVGDSLERDIVPARSLGMATAWVAPAGSASPAADIVVESILDLDAVAL